METDSRRASDCRNPDDPARCAMCVTCREPCQVYEDDKACGETQTLQIVKEFRELYQKKLRQIESAGGGDCAQAKINLQQDWISDLTEQNDMLIKAIEELEQEATERVRLLEQRLNRSGSAEKEVMRKYSQVELAFNITGALQEVAHLQSDIQTLLEFIRRIREENSWSVDGLRFYVVKCTDILGCCKNLPEETEESCPAPTDQKGQTKSDEKDKKIAELEAQLERLKKYGGTSCILKTLNEHDNLKKSMLEMRDALTAEVAEKHDIILSLKQDMLRLEEQCLQTNKHAQFKDDIIKELRREIKQLKHHMPGMSVSCMTPELQEQYTGMQEENEKLKSELNALKQQLQEVKRQAEQNYKEKEALEREIQSLEKEKESFEKIHNDSLKVVEGMTSEICKEKETLMKKQQESVTVIEALRKENEKHKDTLEQTRRSNRSAIENLERALMQDVADARKRHSESVEKIEILQTKMDKLKDDLRGASHRISSLTEENQMLKQTIEQLQAEIVEKEKKPVMSCHGTNPRKRKVENGGTSTESPDNRDECIQFESEVTYQKKIHDLEEKLVLIQNKDEVIKIQTDTLNIVQIELQALRSKETFVEHERNKRNQEILNLKQTIKELEDALANCRTRGDNLQNAIQQQRITISNLQEALIAAKHELEDFKQKNSQEQTQHFFIADVMLVNLLYLENKYSFQNFQLCQLNEVIDNLRDTILDLEVEKVDFLSDISMLESGLQKYQCHFSLSEQGCICPLKVELKKLTIEKLRYEKVIQYLKEEMQMLAEQLANLQNILSASNTNTIEENTQLARTIGELQVVNTQLQDEIAKQVQINQSNEAHINDLEGLLEDKEAELQQLQNALAEREANLEASIMQVTEQQQFIEQLQSNEDQHYEHAMAGDSVQAEVCNCQESVKDVKEKLLAMKATVQQKTTEVAQLREQFAEQSQTLHRVTRDYEENNRRMRDEVDKSQQTIRTLNDRIKTLQDNICDGNPESSQRKANLQTKAVETNRQETNILEKAREDEDKQSLLKQIKKLEDEISSVHQRLASKDEQLSTARATIQQLRDEGNKQEEVMELKEEINRLLQIQGQLKKENEKLRVQVARLKTNLTSYQEQTQTVGEQLEQCLLELQALQADKDAVDQKNEQLFMELQTMQNAFANLSRECFIKTKELHDTKSSKNQVCAESRNIIENVRSWLQEQKGLNDKLHEKMKEKNVLIKRLKQQNNHIIQKLTYYEKSFEPELVPSKLDAHGTESRGVPSTVNTSRWSSATRGGTTSAAVTATTDSITSSIQEWYTYSDAEDETNFTPDLWVRRVESMTEDLQRSNAYWQNNLIVSDYIVRRDE